MLDQSYVSLADLFQYNLLWILICLGGAYWNWRKRSDGTAWFFLFLTAVIVVWSFCFLLLIASGVINV